MKTLFKTSLLITFLLHSSISFSTPYVGKITLIKGKVSYLAPRATKAIFLKKGDRLQEDSSILTYKRSFVRASLVDGSRITLGPKSKIVVKLINKKSGTIIGLLKGKIRSSLKRGNKKDKKFFIKTRTAALGVRGTDFETFYNSQNKSTSAITYRGKVAMVKVKEEPVKISTKEVKVVNSKGEVRKVRRIKARESINKMKEALKSKQAVEINPGRHATVVDHLKRVTVPVKISPKQFKLLKKQVAPIERKEVKVNETELAKNDPPAEGFFDSSTEKFAPKAGGYIDTKTGTYIAPDKEAIFNTAKKVFIPTAIVGKVSKKDGEYIAPKGLKIDPKKGFVVAKANNKKERERLNHIKEELNKNIVTANQDQTKTEKIEIIKKQVKIVDGKKDWKHSIEFGFLPVNMESKYESKTDNIKNRIEADSADLKLDWTFKAFEIFTVTIGIKSGKREYNSKSNHNFNKGRDESTNTFKIEGMYSHDKKLYSKFGLFRKKEGFVSFYRTTYEDNYTETWSNMTFESYTEFKGAAGWRFINSDKNIFAQELILGIQTQKDGHDIKLGNGYLYGTLIRYERRLSGSFGIGIMSSIIWNKREATSKTSAIKTDLSQDTFNLGLVFNYRL